MILLCRHAQSPENLYGKGACADLPQVEIPLTEDGQQQAIVLGQQVVRWCRAHQKSTLEIKTSPYRRVQETAKIVAAELNRAGIAFSESVDPRLGEIDFLPRGADLKEGYTLFSNRVLALESVAQVEARLKAVVDYVFPLPALILTHSTPMRGLATLLAGKPFAAIADFPRPDNCALWQPGAGMLPQVVFAGFPPPARIAAPEDVAGERRFPIT